MPPRHTEEEQADFAKALVSIAEQGSLSQPEVDTLSVLDGADLDRFREVWAALPAGARARLIVALRGTAEERLRLDFTALNHLALEDADPQVRLAGVRSAIEDRSPALLNKLLELVSSDASVEVRFAAAEDLARFTLLGELEDLEPEVTTDLKKRLLNVVRDQNQAARVRGSALAALGYFSDGDNAKELASGFSDPILRLGAVRAMGRTADPRWTDRLMPVLGSDDPQLRLEAARALGVKGPPTATFRIALRLGAPSLLAVALGGAGFSDVMVERWPVVARYDTVNAAVLQAMDHTGTRELMELLSRDSERRMSRSLAQRWQKYADQGGVKLPGEQLVAVGAKSA